MNLIKKQYFPFQQTLQLFFPISKAHFAVVRQKKQALTLSESAAVRIKEILQQQSDSEIIGVKIGVRLRGCNGLTYVMNYCSQKNIEKLDEVVIDKGVKVVLDSKAVMALIGTQMDYLEDEIKSEFVFNNPNAKGHCGCGESFHL